MYDYQNAKKRVWDILNSKTPVEKKSTIPSREEEFTYKNGIKAWVGAIFVDIVDSSTIFKSGDEKIARIIRAFSKEIINILSDSNNYRQIGIRGDCVYGIYSTPYKSDLGEIFTLAYTVNTFMGMLNAILVKSGFQRIQVGIGLGCSEDLVIKVGKEKSGINDMVWIGSAVVDAANLSSKANRGNVSPIAMSTLFYTNIIKSLIEENSSYNTWIKKYVELEDYKRFEFYHCSIIDSKFNDWIKQNL
ncbi:adenylate/guanylate cyclase domain-containing protein [Liberiplasma polymorphum]|uniref:adenylate/guanylate cyclase domain-containing protein n=1 Tax=Liberiplasma polymorphum TaxID=3374570 RepID=UPI0037735E97